MSLITPNELRTAISKTFGKSGFTKLLYQAMQVKRINRFYEQHENDTSEEFITAVTNRLNLKFEINQEELKKIPAEGPFITVSNHPYGGIDGLILMKIFSQIRPDYKILASNLLQRVKPLQPFMLPINPLEQDIRESTLKGIKHAFLHLQEGHPLGLFPSGEVSSYKPGTKVISDEEWQFSILKFIKKTKVPVVPIHFHSKNRSNLNLISVFWPWLKPNQLPQELFNRRNRAIYIRVGNPIPVKDLDHFDNIYQLGRFLRVKTYALGSTLDVKKFYRKKLIVRQEESEKIVDSVGSEKLLEDISKISKEHFLFKLSNYSVYCVPSFEIPNILNEIGRLREITFRAVGEGTNKSIDLDEYDLYYYHLFIWDNEKNQVVGAYRVGKGRDIVNQYGKKGFYLHSLFKIDDGLLPILGESLELGRSFICNEYQQKPVPLFLLWKGILYFLLKHKEYRYLIGPVSISNQFSKISKALITEFIKSNHYNHELAKLIRPRTQFVANFPEVDTNIILESTHHDINKFDKLIEEIEPANFKLPVLLKKYIKLNAKIIGFNIDPKFNDALDGLILLDLFNVPLETIKSLSKELEDTNILERFYNNDPELMKNIPTLTKP